MELVITMRRLNASIYLKVPTMEELYLTELLLSDIETMKFNEKWGGVVPFPKEKWKQFHDDYILSKEKHYFHIYNLDGIFRLYKTFLIALLWWLFPRYKALYLSAASAC